MKNIISTILTAIGNPLVNDELRKISEFTVINDDIQYQDGIFEKLEITTNINYIILNQILPGELTIEELIEKIENYNGEIKIILILENYDEKLEKILIKQGVYRIVNGNNMQTNDIIKIITEDGKLEKYNNEIQKEIERLKECIGNKRNEKYNCQYGKEINYSKECKYVYKKNNLKINEQTNNNYQYLKPYNYSFIQEKVTEKNNKKIINNYNNKIQKNNKKKSIIGTKNKNAKKSNMINTNKNMDMVLQKIVAKIEKILKDCLETIVDYRKKQYYPSKVKDDYTNIDNSNNNKNGSKSVNEENNGNINKDLNSINMHKKNKIISIIGNSGAGKSVFSIMLATALKKYYKRILLIDCDEFNNSLHTLLEVKKYPKKVKRVIMDNNSDKSKIATKDLIVSLNRGVDLISSINLLYNYHNTFCVEELQRITNELSKVYDVIIFDTSTKDSMENTREIINLSEKSIFVTEANISEISKSKRLLELYGYKKEKNNINIVFNKYTHKSIGISKLRKIYMDYPILGYIKLGADYSAVMDKGVKNINVNNILL